MHEIDPNVSMEMTSGNGTDIVSVTPVASTHRGVPESASANEPHEVSAGAMRSLAVVSLGLSITLAIVFRQYPALTSTIGILTLLVVVWYTWETSKMQKAVTKQVNAAGKQTALMTEQIIAITKQTDVYLRQLEEMTKQTGIAHRQRDELIHQRRVSIMPAFVAEVTQEFDGTHSEKPLMVLTNVGNGVAINVAIDTAYLPNLASEKFFGKPPNLVFDAVTVIRSGESKPLRAISHFGDSPAPRALDHIRALRPSSDEIVTVVIRFVDLEGRHYIQELQMGRVGCLPGPVSAVLEPVTQPTDGCEK